MQGRRNPRPRPGAGRTGRGPKFIKKERMFEKGKVALAKPSVWWPPPPADRMVHPAQPSAPRDPMTTAAPAKPAAITIQPSQEPGNVTLIKRHGDVEVYEHDGWLCFPDRIREVRVGPFTAE